MKAERLLERLLAKENAYAKLEASIASKDKYRVQLEAQNQELFNDNSKLREECAYWQRMHCEVLEELNQGKPKVELELEELSKLSTINRILYNWKTVNTGLFELDDRLNITNLEYWDTSEDKWLATGKYDDFGRYLYRNKPKEIQDDKDKEEKEA